MDFLQRNPDMNRFAQATSMARLPRNRPPTHPGEILRSDYLEPLGMTQVELADAIRVSYPRVNEIINGRRGITPDTALRLSALFGTTPEFWLNGQRNWDLWHAMRAPEAKVLKAIVVESQLRNLVSADFVDVVLTQAEVDRQFVLVRSSLFEDLDCRMAAGSEDHAVNAGAKGLLTTQSRPHLRTTQLDRGSRLDQRHES